MDNALGFALQASAGSDDETKLERQHLRGTTTTTTNTRQQLADNRRGRRAHKFTITASSVVMPLVMMFLLPSRGGGDDAQLTHADDRRLAGGEQNHHLATLLPPLPLVSLLESLLEYPLERLRFGLVGSALAAAASASAQRADLLEDEDQAHMVLMAPPAGITQSLSTTPSAVLSAQRSTPVRRSGHPAAAAEMSGAEMDASAQADLHAAGASAGADAASMGAYHRAGISEGGGGGNMMSPDIMAGEGVGSEVGAGALAQSASALQARNDLPAVRALNVKCEKNHMTVNIVFDRPFYGLVFSKGHYNDKKCVHLPANSGQTSVNFDIHLGKCGMSSSDAGAALMHQNGGGNGGGGAHNAAQPNGLFIENTIIIQYDAQVQEIYDQARKLRCTWYDYYEKSVTFKPYNVDMLDAVTANFLGDNIQCWMQIQVGKGPWSSEVAGIVKIGQTMTMVLAIKDDENRFDMLVRNCIAHDGNQQHQPIQLVDEYGCVARPKIMAKFQKVRNFGPAATVVSYAHFQAFKFPDSMSVHFQCVIQVCRYECPEPACHAGASGPHLSGGGGNANGDALGGPTGAGSGQPMSAGGDYAASGTEIVSQKEVMPPPPVHMSTHSPLAYMHNASGAELTSGPQSSVQLKLDESQGKLAVKLDTSMMAGPAAGTQQQQHTRASSGPLPPHLLHLAAASPSYAPHHHHHHHHQQHQQHTQQHHYQPQMYNNNNNQPMQAYGGKLNNVQSRQQHMMGKPTLMSAPATMPMRSSASVAPGGAGSHMHYSSPYPPVAAGSSLVSHVVRPAYATNRMGELAPESPALNSSASVLMSTHQEPLTGYPISLLAAPRGVQHQLVTIATNHRYRREITLGAGDHRNSRQPQSTDIKTQKTIQVVSPDDLTFSLLDDNNDAHHDEDLFASHSTTTEQTKQQQQQHKPQRPSTQRHISPMRPPTVCFSTVKFMFGIFVTLASLASSLVVVAYFYVRQRNNKKLASVLVEQEASSIASSPSPSDLLRRQHDELERRNTYLTRIYSQFAPASYWRA